MRTIVLLFSLLFHTLSFAQDDIVDKIVHVRTLLSDASQFNPNEALSQLQLIEEQCVSSDNDTLKAVFASLKGQTLYFMERYEECIPLCKKAIDLFEQSNLRQYEYLDAFQIIAMSYHRLKDYNNAENYYRKGLLKSVSANVNTTDSYRANLYFYLGKLYETKGDSILAVECYDRSKQLQEIQPVDIDEWNYIEWENSCWENVNAYVQSEQYQEAVDVYSDMIKVIEEKRGKEHKYILVVYSKAILLSRYLLKFDEALPLYEEVVNCGNKASIYDESVCGAYCNIALCYAYKGDFSKIDPFILEAIKKLKEANNEHYPPHSIYRFAGNGAYWKQNYEKAIKYYEQYLAPINKREEGTSYEEITNQLSVSYILANKPNKAKQLLVDFLKSEEKRLESENISTLANIYHNLGRAYMLENSITEALKYLNKSKGLQTQIWGEVSEKTQRYIEECKSK